VRARYLLRDMAAGDVDAWNRAELKLRHPDVHPENKRALSDAMAALADPRTDTEKDL
jgi:hypothetical protein